MARDYQINNKIL